MADIKRYSMTMEFYIYADSDKNAVDLAEHIVEKQKKNGTIGLGYQALKNNHLVH